MPQSNIVKEAESDYLPLIQVLEESVKRNLADLRGISYLRSKMEPRDDIMCQVIYFLGKFQALIL